jgi:hypothetical protein
VEIHQQCNFVIGKTTKKEKKMADTVNWNRFKRDVPQWYTEAKFGIFIHWGAYSVPAFGEPIGELGTMEAKTWFPHNQI